MIKFFKGFFAKKKIKLGLGLGGGGAKGSVHLGALKAFEEEGIVFDIVAGTSIGSIIGGLYARGYSAREIEGFVLSAGINDLKNLIIARISGSGIDGLLQTALGRIEFSELKKPFAAVAVDLASGQETIFTEGNLIKAMASSSAIAPYFRSVNYNGKEYVDGAYKNIIPCDVAKNMGADFVIGIDLSGGRQTTEGGKKMLDDMYPSNGVAVCNPTAAGYASCDFMLAPDLSGFTSTSFGGIGQMYDIGYFTAKEKMPDIKLALKKAGYKF